MPGAPYAVALDPHGLVLAKGTVNDGAQLRSVLSAAGARVRAAAEVRRPSADTSRRAFLSRAAAGVAGAGLAAGMVRPGEAEAYHFCGHIYTTDGCPHPTGLPRIDRRGLPLRALDGRKVDDLGRLIDLDGQPSARTASGSRPRGPAAAGRAAHRRLHRGPPTYRIETRSTAPGTAAAAAACASSSTAARPRISGSTATSR